MWNSSSHKSNYGQFCCEQKTFTTLELDRAEDVPGDHSSQQEYDRVWSRF